jgi:outer membrane protein assembly factor BamB
MNGNAGKPVEVHAFQRLADGVTMIAESGPSRIIEVDRDGKLLKAIPLKVSKSDPHRDTRLVRKLIDGHYLVAHEGDNAVREYDETGKVVWEYAVGSRVYSATRLGKGHTLIGAGDGHRVIEVDWGGHVVWSLNATDIPGVKLAWVTMVERLPNDNTLVVNCHAGPDNPQIIEVTPEKKVVWTFKDFEHFGNALPVARVLPAEKR